MPHRVQPVDMFPHTTHIETVVTLEKMTSLKPCRTCRLSVRRIPACALGRSSSLQA